MRVVKPSRLSMLTRPYRWQGVDLLGTAVLALATLDDIPSLMSEQALWRVASEEAGGLLDLGVPKACAEFLVSGMAYTRHQADKTACAVRARVGELEKSLLVFGDRYWLDGRATAPAAFDAMRVDWRHAYGGPDSAENPLGMGMQPCCINGVNVVPLPNVESPTQRLSRPGQVVRPASFDSIGPDTPARFARMGTQYDQGWVEREFPGFAPDMDWRYFNAAPSDQWWSERSDVPADVDYEIWNMHPDSPVQRGRLPDWRVRCFATRQGSEPVLEEIPQRLTTVWFFPHHERVLLIWHGVLEIRENDAADIAHIMPAIELPGAGRAIDHYRDVLRRRTDPREGAIHAMRDSDLVEPALYALAPDPALPDIDARPLARNLHAGTARRRASYRQTLVAEGLNPDDYLPPPAGPAPKPTLDNLASILDAVEQQRKEGEALLARGRDAMLNDADLRRFGEAAGIDIDAIARTDAGGPNTSRLDPQPLMRQLREFDERFPSMPSQTPTTPTTPTPTPTPTPTASASASASSFASPDSASDANHSQKASVDQIPKSPRRSLRDNLGPQVGQLYLHTAHIGAAPNVMPPHRARRTRLRVDAIYRRGRDFTGVHLIGADLSGMDLRGSCFRGAALEGAKLDGACLDDCDFTHAVLARISMTGGSLARARLQQANAAGARFDGVSLTATDLNQTLLGDTRFLSCSFSGAILAQTRLDDTRFEDCDFRAATLEEVAPLKAHFHTCHFDDATLRRCAFMECTLAGDVFHRARLTRCGFVNCTFGPGMDFTGARFEMSSVSSGTTLAGICLDDAELRQCGWRGVRLENASLVHATLHASDFSECTFVDARLDGVDAADSLFVRADFTGASLRGAKLIQSLMAKADFTRTDLREANLFRADLAEAVLDGTTLLRGAYTDGAKLWPKRRTSPSGTGGITSGA